MHACLGYPGTMRSHKTVVIGYTVVTILTLYVIVSNYRHDPEVNCCPNVPCVYPDPVDFRIIVIVYNRAKSLTRILQSLNSLETDGAKVALEIWIDKGKNGRVSEETVQAAEDFEFKHGKKRVHVQKIHVGGYGQWTYTWRAPAESNELALLLEDDLTVSPYVWRYLRMVHSLYGHIPDCGGYTIQCENVNIANASLTQIQPMTVDPSQDTYMYQLIGTWGFMPHPLHWAKFQDWFDIATINATFRPVVPGIKSTEWYKDAEANGKQDTMWEMWYIYYATINNLYTVYPNSNGVFNNEGNCFSINRQEAGGHYTDEHTIKSKDVYKKLLKRWPKKLYRFPSAKSILRFDYDGRVVSRENSPTRQTAGHL